MNRNKKIFNTLFMIVIVVAVETLVCASDDLQPSMPENDYVLRSCMSSVELSRHNANNPKSKTHVSPHSPRRRPAFVPTTQYPISRYPVKSMETRIRKFGKSQQQLEQRMLRKERPGRQMIADTPLTTLKVERRGRKNIPQLYVKHDLLPEIKSPVADGKKDEKNEASIIVIEASPRRSLN